MSGKFRGFFDVITGFLLGSGTAKIYYETIDSQDHRESFSFRQDKRKINEICTSHDNLKFGKDERVIKGENVKIVQNEIPELSRRSILKFGSPQRSPEILYYKNHILGYDHTKKIPLWVAEHLTKDDIMLGKDNAAVRTKSSFHSDPNIPVIFQAQNEDYYKSGWTRGHMAPAGDNKHDQESMNETFLLSNILPQDYNNNTNFWYRMEVFCRNLTKQFTDVYVISGPLWLPYQQGEKKFVTYEVIGENNVAVPTHLFKVILAIDSKDVAFVGAFEVPNEAIPREKKLRDFQVPLTKLEKDSGFHLFQTIDQSKARDLCETTGCRLLLKETLIISGQLKNAQTLEQLEEIWSGLTNKDIHKDNHINSTYQKKLQELHKKQSSLNNTVDNTVVS